ncbi:MAG TPA: hypothetical protein PKB07_25665 [Flavilitoribacter sp.]|nr:hypothetical protein [Flavilitoribacter sp.]
MKHVLSACLLLFCSYILSGQGTIVLKNGKVSYLSSTNVYVRFESTSGIEIGDTLFRQQGSRMIPVVVVSNKSSSSCVGVAVPPQKVAIGDVLLHRKEEPVEPPKPAQEPAAEAQAADQPDTPAKESLRSERPVAAPDIIKENIRGRVSAASYSNISETRTDHRMRYTFSMQGNYLADSRVSADVYITFRHTLNRWEEVRDNISNALKIYALSVRYDFNNSSQISLGRKINPKLSSVGAIDGLQYEGGKGDWRFGAILGARPDYTDYSLNPNLLQAGVYASKSANLKNGYRQTTLGLIQQMNSFRTDRRYLYFQHSGSLTRNIYLFGSLETDLFENVNDHPKTTLSLTNLYAMVRYKATKKLNLTVSYDQRKDILYYETFKTYIDSLLERETYQGLRFNANYRPFKYVSCGGGASWRFQKDNGNLSKNLNGYLTYSRIPWLEMSASATANFLQTNYLDSKIFDIRLSRDFIGGKLSGDLYFRMVDYAYKNYEYNVRQQIAGVSFSARLTRQLGLYFYYEGTMDDRNKMYSRLNTKIVKRF